MSENSMVTTVKGQLVRPTNLVSGLNPTEWWITNTIFEDCTVIGPAVLWGEALQIRNSMFDTAKMSDVVIPIPADRESLVGVIGLRACLFERCRFTGIAIAVPEAQVGHFLETFESPDA